MPPSQWDEHDPRGKIPSFCVLLLQGLIRWSHNQICKPTPRLFNYSLTELFVSVEFVFKDASNPHLFGLNTYRIIPIGGPRHPVFV